MPHVNVRLAGTATKEEKKQIIEKMTQVLYDVLNKPHARTHVVIEEVDPANWGIGAETIEEIRKKS
ncbi:4-oxalocrotonate tautomerase family protein [Rickettsiales bacterium]|nr:4-oxalocrotonate tautomerase family protein [Rickettsiales bacterium]